MRMQPTMWLGLALVSMLSGGAATLAASDGTHASDKNLVDVVQRATDRYRDPNEAIRGGWLSADSCVTGPEQGAMGVHFIKGGILFDGAITPEEPEALIYEVDGSRARLVGVEYIVIAKQWHEHNPGPPVILGQQAHFVDAPNRFGLDPFYELHVWAWRENVNGMFVDWNPAVTCDRFEPAQPQR